MISALLQVEGPFAVAVYCPADPAPASGDMARDHYGSRVPITICDRLNQAVSAVLDGKATVAILPFPTRTMPSPGGRIHRPGAAWSLRACPLAIPAISATAACRPW